jgi:hypothetical protein
VAAPSFEEFYRVVKAKAPDLTDEDIRGGYQLRFGGSGLSGSLARGVQQFGSSVRTGIESLAGDPTRAGQAAVSRSQDLAARYPNEVGLEPLKQAYAEGGVLGAGVVRRQRQQVQDERRAVVHLLERGHLIELISAEQDMRRVVLLRLEPDGHEAVRVPVQRRVRECRRLLLGQVGGNLHGVDEIRARGEVVEVVGHVCAADRFDVSDEPRGRRHHCSPPAMNG